MMIDEMSINNNIIIYLFQIEHDKKWIEDLVCETLRYYRSGPGKEDKRQRYKIMENSKVSVHHI